MSRISEHVDVEKLGNVATLPRRVIVAEILAKSRANSTKLSGKTHRIAALSLSTTARSSAAVLAALTCLMRSRSLIGVPKVLKCPLLDDLLIFPPAKPRLDFIDLLDGELDGVGHALGLYL